MPGSTMDPKVGTSKMKCPKGYKRVSQKLSTGEKKYTCVEQIPGSGAASGKADRSKEAFDCYSKGSGYFPVPCDKDPGGKRCVNTSGRNSADWDSATCTWKESQAQKDKAAKDATDCARLKTSCEDPRNAVKQMWAPCKKSAEDNPSAARCGGYHCVRAKGIYPEQTKYDENVCRWIKPGDEEKEKQSDADRKAKEQQSEAAFKKMKEDCKTSCKPKKGKLVGEDNNCECF